MAEVRFEGVSHRYPGSSKLAVDSLDLRIQDGEFLVLVGPSGCGKTTSLRMLAGLEEVDEGSIFIGDRDITNLAPKDRDVAMVFQNYALYPHMTVAQNMSYALRVAHKSKSEIIERINEAARLLNLEELLDRKPKALSGGQRQRVAMGRAIVREPKVFLMDEPLSNLDAKLRVETRTQLAELQRRLMTTTVYVTHDQVEGMTMGDRVAVMKDGVLLQLGTPLELYDAPVSAFVAGFIGSPSMSFFELPINDDGVKIDGLQIRLPREVIQRAARSGLTSVQIGLRPEDAMVSTESSGLNVVVDYVEELGADAYVYGRLTSPGGPQSKITIRMDGRQVPKFGEAIQIAVREEHVHVFSPETGLSLSKGN